ncbi:MAG: GTP-binding protein [Chloroflexi bacterium]|nr:GTP-binding protein [Chloroflexota bacterium]MCH2307028.1 zinc ribbon domain-containing protein [SAR202 cluster bacterium]|tara:strand:- start:752 stop:958 length:207 start_codon:yes stop_codon:yes gene_type:complete
MNKQYECAKCGSTQFTNNEIRTTGSGLSRFFDIQNQKFTAVTCNNCGYTELFKVQGGGIGNFFDFLSG